MAKDPDDGSALPPSRSSGYLVRDANRAFQRMIEQRIAPFGVTRGQWYFLRALWIEDGLSQRANLQRRQRRRTSRRSKAFGPKKCSPK